MRRPDLKVPEPCDHRWAGDMDGGQPEFVRNRHLSSRRIASVVCLDCDARTWMSRDQWDDHLGARTDFDNLRGATDEQDSG